MAPYWSYASLIQHHVCMRQYVKALYGGPLFGALPQPNIPSSDRWVKFRVGVTVPSIVRVFWSYLSGFGVLSQKANYIDLSSVIRFSYPDCSLLASGISAFLNGCLTPWCQSRHLHATVPLPVKTYLCGATQDCQVNFFNHFVLDHLLTHLFKATTTRTKPHRCTWKLSMTSAKPVHRKLLVGDSEMPHFHADNHMWKHPYTEVLLVRR